MKPPYSAECDATSGSPAQTGVIQMPSSALIGTISSRQEKKQLNRSRDTYTTVIYFIDQSIESPRSVVRGSGYYNIVDPRTTISGRVQHIILSPYTYGRAKSWKRWYAEEIRS